MPSSQGLSRNSDPLLFAEADEIKECIESLKSSERKKALRRIRIVLDKYLECPTLLDASLQTNVDHLANLIDWKDQESLPYLLSVIYVFIKVRGRKVIQRFLPHEVTMVTMVWQALISFDDTPNDDHDSSSPPHWESIYVLWIWMSSLSLIPFDCTVMVQKELVPKLVERARTALSTAGPIREAAASCYAAWLCRADWEAKEVPSFITWAEIVLSQPNTTGNNHRIFLMLGVLQTLNTLLKHSPMPRDKLHQLTFPLWNSIWQLSIPHHDLLLQKACIKWWTRLSTAVLPLRIAPWRYQRGQRSLLHNLQKQQMKGSVTQKFWEDAPRRTLDQDLFLVPDHVEDAMGKLLEALGHKSTMVRWSAAKGIGRMTERLPALCAEDVLDAVLQYCEDEENDNHWHGACLTLAELGRRGLLLPHRLSDAVPIIIRGIQYDVPRGHCSVGAHVRDAACYTYWAFARAYSPQILRPYMKRLSEAVILTCLFDREVNCRRAASAAFQEAVGRQGDANFAHGIDILTVADYFSLGNRTHAYTSIAPAVAQYIEYTRPILRHLALEKLCHWDAAIRTLASKALAAVAPLDIEYIDQNIFPTLMGRCVDPQSIAVRHGAVLGVAEVILALSSRDCLGLHISVENIESLKALAPDIEKKRLYRGRGGEIMRAAVCRLIECVSDANVALTVAEQVRLLDSVDSSIPHPNESIQQAACQALSQLISVHFPVGEKGPSNRLQSRVVSKFLDQVNNSHNPAATRGYALALGYLPLKLLSPTRSVLSQIIDCLAAAANMNARVGGEGDAETRRNALVSLTGIARTTSLSIQGKYPYPVTPLNTDIVHRLFDVFLFALQDYKSDRRGDVGSWCRMSGMRGLVELILVVSVDERLIDGERITQAVSGILKQAAEKLDSVRSVAELALKKVLLSVDPVVDSVRGKDDLVQILGLENDLAPEESWTDPVSVFPRLLQAASVSDGAYFDAIIEGMVLSIGGLTQDVSRASSTAMLDWTAGLSEPVGKKRLLEFLTGLLSRSRRTNRVFLPTLKTVGLLLSRPYLDGVLQDCTESLLDSMTNGLEGCCDIHRLMAISEGLVSICLKLTDCDVRQRALTALCEMLGHEFPRLRSHAAEQLYLVLVESSSPSTPDEGTVDLVLNAPWTADLEQLLPTIDLIMDRIVQKN